MPHKLSSAAIEGLRSTLQSVEEHSGLMSDDSALVELKRILVARIAELEAVQRASESADQAGPAVLEFGPTSGDPAMTLALDLAVSLVAERSAGREFEPDKMQGAASESQKAK